MAGTGMAAGLVLSLVMTKGATAPFTTLPNSQYFFVSASHALGTMFVVS